MSIPNNNVTVEFLVDVEKCRLVERWRAIVPAGLEGDELLGVLYESLGKDGGAMFVEQTVDEEEDRIIIEVQHL